MKKSLTETRIFIRKWDGFCAQRGPWKQYERARRQIKRAGFSPHWGTGRFCAARLLSCCIGPFIDHGSRRHMVRGSGSVAAYILKN